MWDAAQLVDAKLDDPARALELYERVLKLDPDHVEAGAEGRRPLVAAKRWDDALPVLEMLARQAEGDATVDRKETAQRQAQLGKAYEELHRTEKAARHYRLAVEADPDSLDAAIGLAAVLDDRGEGERGQRGRGGAVEGSRSPLSRDPRAPPHQRSPIARSPTSGTGSASRRARWARTRRPRSSYRRALEKDPLHEPTLEAMVELGGARGEWREVADAKRAQIDALAKRDGTDFSARSCSRRSATSIASGSRTSSSATNAYQEGLKIAPASRVLLHKLLEALHRAAPVAQGGRDARPLSGSRTRRSAARGSTTRPR